MEELSGEREVHKRKKREREREKKNKRQNTTRNESLTTDNKLLNC